MKERLESIINKYGIDDENYTMMVFICLSWVEYL